MTAAMNQTASDLLARIERCEAKIGVVGLGYVGLPLAHALHQGGLPILGFDIDQSKIDAIKALIEGPSTWYEEADFGGWAIPAEYATMNKIYGKVSRLEKTIRMNGGK